MSVSVRQKSVPDDLFVLIWNRSNSVQEVADNIKEYLGIEVKNPKSLSTRASQFRELGIEMKSFTSNRLRETPEQRAERINGVMSLVNSPRNKGKSLADLISRVQEEANKE